MGDSGHISKILCTNVWKIFGPDEHTLLEKLDSGADKSTLMSDSGNVIAVQDVSFTVNEGETFVIMGLIPLWLAVLVVSRDVLISTGILILRLNAYQIEVKPSILSKCTTFLQVVTIGITLLLHILKMSSAIIVPLYWITGILTIGSGIHYIFRGMKLTIPNNN